MTIVDGATGEALAWSEVIARAFEADIIIAGETHGDAAGHAFQEALARRLASDGGTAFALEMLARDAQPLADLYAAGVISEQSLAEALHPAGPEREAWAQRYLPLARVAKTAGVPLCAPNAPRKYARLARLEGFEALERLPRHERRLFALPRTRDQAYFERFAAAMAHHPHGSDGPDSDASEPVHSAEPAVASEDAIDAMFRAQRLWDAAMADAVVRQRPRGGRMLLVVGRFHSDYAGGVVKEIEARAPRSRMLTLSLVPEQGLALREEDRHRADIVVYTGPTIGTDEVAP